ncbi:MAG: hypothetical protein ACR2PQ_06545 [Myxococcota bacterium]
MAHPSRARNPRSHFAFALLALSTAFGSGAAAGEDTYYPTAEGTLWEYSARYSTPDHLGIPPRSGRRIERLEGREEHDGKTYLRFSSTLEGIGTEPVTGRSLLRVAEGGVYFRTDASAEDTLGLPLPPLVGHTWSSSNDWGEWRGTVTRELAIETPAGRFESCVEVSTELVEPSTASRGRLSQQTTYCRGVGPVQRVMTTESEGPAGPIRGVTEETLTRTTREEPTR